jgi:hypothetical protein
MKHTFTWFVLSLALVLGCGTKEVPRQAGAAARSKPYVASVLREPFHKSSCRWASKITQPNLTGYDSKADAVADGHRPCKVCKP